MGAWQQSHIARATHRNVGQMIHYTQHYMVIQDALIGDAEISDAEMCDWQPSGTLWSVALRFVTC